MHTNIVQLYSRIHEPFANQRPEHLIKNSEYDQEIPQSQISLDR